MANNNPIEISAIQVAPVYRNSTLALRPTSVDGFTQRHHFPYMAGLTSLALLITLKNRKLKAKGRAEHSCEVTFCLDRVDESEIDLFKNATLSMAECDTEAKARFDIPLTDTGLEPDTLYQLRVFDGDSFDVMASTHIAFIDPSLPTEIVPLEPCEAFVFDPKLGEVDPVACVALSTDPLFEITPAVAFDLIDNVSDQLGFLPEIIIDFVGENGHREERIAKIVKDDYFTDFDLRAYAEIPDADFGAAVSASLKCMDMVIATAAYPLDAEDNQPGRYEACDIEPDSIRPSEWIARIRDRTALMEAEIKAESRRRDEQNRASRMESAMERLNGMTGLNSIKEMVKGKYHLTTFMDRREAMGLKSVRPSLHSMFLGNPGTGKTTVARLMGEMMKAAGALSSGHVVFTERAALVGHCYGQAEENTHNVLQNAKGGILFVDEAYQLFMPNDPKDPGRQVLDSVITAMSEERDLMIILAGYPAETRRLFDLNPGLRSRIPDCNIFMFDDYSLDELLEIGRRYFDRNDFTLTPEAWSRFAERVNVDYDNRGNGFGNARYVVTLIENQIIPAMASRLFGALDITRATMSTILPADIPLSATFLPTFKPRKMGFVG